MPENQFSFNRQRLIQGYEGQVVTRSRNVVRDAGRNFSIDAPAETPAAGAANAPVTQPTVQVPIGFRRSERRLRASDVFGDKVAPTVTLTMPPGGQQQSQILVQQPQAQQVMGPMGPMGGMGGGMMGPGSMPGPGTTRSPMLDRKRSPRRATRLWTSIISNSSKRKLPDRATRTTRCGDTKNA